MLQSLKQKCSFYVVYKKEKEVVVSPSSCRRMQTRPSKVIGLVYVQACVCEQTLKTHTQCISMLVGVIPAGQ